MTPDLSLRALLARSIVPATSGGLYTLIPGALGFVTVLVAYLHSAWTGQAMPSTTGEILTASVTALGVHTVRGALADRANADNGVLPVPSEPSPASSTDL